MTFCQPEQLRKTTLDDGRIALERIPNHPIREAYAHEVNCWYEDAPDPGANAPKLEAMNAATR